MQTLRMALAQINCTVGDLDGNVAKIKQGIAQARSSQADIVVFPELAICGYPPEDLLLKPGFLRDCRAAVEECARAASDTIAIIGFPETAEDTYNAAAVCWSGKIAATARKQYLPNYGVFDENRYFQQGERPGVLRIPRPIGREENTIVGVNICEDIWYPDGPLREQALIGDAEVAINLSASPYHRGKGRWRAQMLGTRAADHVAIVAFCNLVGGQDELIFDGQSMIFNQNGDLIARGKQFEEDFLIADLDVGAVLRHRLHDPRRRKAKQALPHGETAIDRVTLAADAHSQAPQRGPGAPAPRTPIEARREDLSGPIAEVYRALVLGTRDYVTKSRFQKVFLGLSGGVDSALVAAIAADAVGAANVCCVAMPSQFSSDQSYQDAMTLCEAFGIRLIALPIEEIFDRTLAVLGGQFEGLPFGLAEENLQARIRGNLLMTMSNKLGGMVLTTGNKSETSVGYSTLYGDTAGGLAVIKDVPKTLVYELCRYRNELAGRAVIPESILERAPTAELRPDQKDSDSLPPYEVLDPILRLYVEEDRTQAEIVENGFDEVTVRRVLRLVDAAEYKRRQSPPGLKITTRAFGRDRRLPIVNAYRDDSLNHGQT